MYFVGGHYRQPLAFSPRQLEEAASRASRVRETGRRLAPGASPPDLAALRERFFEALAADFNTAEALAAMFEWVREANRRVEGGQAVGDADLREMLGVMALGTLLEAAADDQPDPRVRDLVERRERARRDRDFPAADRLRAQVEALGWEIRDRAGGPELVRRS
jgi:cysteinyl-tRNA synthetase